MPKEVARVMAHLPVQEEEDHTIELAPAIQFCVRRALRYRRAAVAMKIAVAVGGVLILAILQLWSPPPFAPQSPPTSPSKLNLYIFYVILAISSIISIVSTVSAVLNCERISEKYEKAIRAVRRLRDRYIVEVSHNPGDPNWIQHLEFWAKEHVYAIETLLEESRVYDVDFHFKISDP
jgi:hypothetical protein